MCYPLPGPRCASHLTTEMTTVREELRALDDALAKDGTNIAIQQRWTDKNNQLLDLGVQYDGTKTGQAKLDDQITHAPNRRTQDYLINRKLVAKDLYDNKKRALKLAQDAKDAFDRDNKALYLQGRDEELVANLMKNQPLDPKETPASRRQAERNALLNFQARMEPYKTATAQLRGAPTVRDNVAPKGYFVVSGQPKLGGSGQVHYLFKGDAADQQHAQLVGHVKVSLNSDFSVRADAYRGDGIVGGERVSKQSSHIDYFKALIDNNHVSPERERFDFDDMRRIDWAAADARAAAAGPRRARVA